MTNYEDLAFEPPLKYEDLKKWALEKGGEIYYFGDSIKGGLISLCLYHIFPEKGLINIRFNKDVFYRGTPAQVKRVLEAMIDD